MLPKKKLQHIRKSNVRKSRPVGKKREIESLVKAGVERFILKDATIDDFLRTVRTATEKEYVYSHQLTTSRFAEIVKHAIRKRKRRVTKAAHS